MKNFLLLLIIAVLLASCYNPCIKWEVKPNHMECAKSIMRTIMINSIDSRGFSHITFASEEVCVQYRKCRACIQRTENKKPQENIAIPENSCKE